MLKAVKIRLYPNTEQQSYMNRLIGCYRKIYNLCLDLKINEYTTNKKSIGLKEFGQYFHQNLKKSEEYSYLNEHNTKVLKQSFIDLIDAYKRFFVNGNGFPKFKSKHTSKQSCRFTVDAISRKNNYLSSRLTLTSALKDVRFDCSDRDKNYLSNHKDKIRSATLSKTKSGKYFLSILIENIITKPLPKPINDMIGLDLGIKSFIVTSDAQVFDNIKIKHNNEKKLNKLHKELSKKDKGSNNRNKARIKLAKFYEKIENQKLNYLHNITTQLVRENQTIIIEDLNVSGMMKNHNLAKSIQELSLYEFRRQLEYKTTWYGRNLILVDRWFPSSKLCSVCGYKYKKLTLDEREWTCPECHTKHDRDYNAATNILNEGKKILNKDKIGTRSPECTLVDYPTMDDKEVIPLKSSDRLKQEEKLPSC